MARRGSYTLKPKDFHDVTLLCERFEIELPPEYRAGHSPQVE